MNKQFPHLFAKSSTGKIKEWWPEVTTEDNKVYLLVTSRYIDGKKTTSRKEIHSKNKGRSNETSPFEQACNEAKSKMNKKIDEGYVLDQSELEEQQLLLPMLAHPFNKRKHNIEYPAYVQPKLNGVRNLAAADKYITRKGKTYDTLSHLDADRDKLLAIIKCKALDGEVYKKGWTFQEIIRAVKKYREGISEKLEYWVYDMIDCDMDFYDRYQTLKNAFTTAGATVEGQLLRLGNIVLVPSYTVHNEENIMSWQKEFVKDDFEGTIIRNWKGGYELKNRSKNLQKYKDMQDSEFDIVGGEEATGNDKGTVIFICKTAERTFSVRPKGSRETRAKWLRELDSIIGKQLTVRYQELSEEGVPIFPVGLAVRDYED